MIIKTSELIYLNDAAKALKQKDFQIINNIIIGINNINNYIIYTELDSNMIYNNSLNGLIINAKELSSFVKTITVESEFNLEPSFNNTLIIKSLTGELVFHSKYDIRIDCDPLYRLSLIRDINCRTSLSEEAYINDKIEQFFLLHKDDGCFYYIHDNKYFITLFSGLLPVNKADKVYLSIYPSNDKSFIAKFRVNKKKFDVFIYLAYLYI